MQKSVVVLGIGRSGTSVTAGILHVLGVSMGEFSSPSRINPKGFYEDINFSNLLIRMWQAAADGKCDFWHPPPLNNFSRIKGVFARDIKKLVAKKSGKALWGWKHPRTSLVIDEFLPHLHNPHFVIVLRSPLNTVRSALRSRHVGDAEHGLRMIGFHLCQIMGVLKRHPGVPRVFVSFEDVVADPVREARRLADFIGVQLTQDQIARINKLVIPRSRIQQERLRAALLHDLPRFVRACLADPLHAPKRLSNVFKNVRKGSR